MLFTMTNGEITTAEISKDEPVWCVNFKKAIALQFQAKSDATSRLNDEGNNLVSVKKCLCLFERQLVL